MRPNPHYLTKHERNMVVIALREKAKRQARLAARMTETMTGGRWHELADDLTRASAEAERLGVLFLKADMVDVWPRPQN